MKSNFTFVLLMQQQQSGFKIQYQIKNPMSLFQRHSTIQNIIQHKMANSLTRN